MPLFELDNASLGYNGKAVLHEVSLRVEPGERVALVGASGAGKSTLLSVLYGQQKARTALIPQDTALVKTLSVFHNVYIGRLHTQPTWYNLLNLARPLKREVEQIAAVLERIGLSEQLFQTVGSLSGGQQQRTGVGRALYHGGEICLGDEPVSSVDERQSRVVLETINEAHRTVVLCMHDVELALAYTHRIVGLKNGRIVLDAPSADLRPTDLAPIYLPE